MKNEAIKNVTITIIFDGSALNRDEVIAGNILSIKKLNVNGEIRSFIGKPALRHYLFQSLHRGFNWVPAKVTGEGQVVQFDLTKDDIISNAELDVFGYMFTLGKKETAITRKSPLGITKAISFFPYESDLAFYSNHDLVSRGKSEGMDVNPSPVNKEEQNSFYKVSFTLDSLILGQDIWIVDDRNYEDNTLHLIFLKAQKEEKDVLERKIKCKKMSGEEAREEIYSVEENGKEIGKIYIKKINLKAPDRGPYKVKFELAKDQKKKRISEVLAAISSGLYAQSSGEANTIIPLFLIAGAVKIPSPVFHPYIDIRRDNGQWRVIGIGDALNNYWIEKSDGRPIVYIRDSERLQVEPAHKDAVEKSWETFLEKLGLSG